MNFLKIVPFAALKILVLSSIRGTIIGHGKHTTIISRDCPGINPAPPEPLIGRLLVIGWKNEKTKAAISPIPCLTGGNRHFLNQAANDMPSHRVTCFMIGVKDALQLSVLSR